MAEKILNTRIALKIDTLENWQKSTIGLKKGELALATVAASAGTALSEPVVMIKVGEDGVKTFSQLEWNVYAKAADVLAACKTEAGLKTFVNGVIADAGIATNAAMEALAGRVTTVEGDLNTATTGLKARMTTAEGAIDALEALVGDKNVATQISEAIAVLNLANTYDAKGAAADAETAAKGHADSLNSAMNTRVLALEAIDHDHANMAVLGGITAEKVSAWDAAEQNAKNYADAEDAKIESRVADLEAKFTGDDSVADQIADAVAAEATLRENADNALQNQIGEASAEGKAATGLHARIEDLEGLVGDEKVSEAIAAAVKVEKERAEGIEGGLESRLAAVEGDYLKAADKEALQTQINTIMSNPDAEGAINSINEFTQYVKNHGTIADGMRTDINKNKDDISAEASRAAGVESGLDTRLKAVEAMVSEDGAVKSDIADALTEAKGYTDTEVKKLADGAVSTNAAAIAAIDALVGDTAVATQITNVTNPLAERVVALEAIDHDHANKAELDLIASGDKAKWDAKVDNVTATADSGLKATRTGNAIAIEIDDSITFVFDCGNSGVTA